MVGQIFGEHILVPPLIEGGGPLFIINYCLPISSVSPSLIACRKSLVGEM